MLVLLRPTRRRAGPARPCRSDSPSVTSTSCSSSSDLRPKFLVSSMSFSLRRTRSRSVWMLAFLRQLAERTERSSSSIVLRQQARRARRAPGGADARRRRAQALLGVDEDAEVVLEQHRGERHRLLGADRAVGPDLEDQPLVVGGAAEARRLDAVVDPPHRAVRRVDRDPADAQRLVEVLLGARRSRGRA